MINLAILITVLGGIILIGKAGWDYFHGAKDVGRSMIFGILALAVGLSIVYEIATGSRDGLVGALMDLFTAVLKNVAASFETSTIGTLSTAVPKIIPTIVATVKP